MQAQGAISALSELLPDSAERINGEDTERVPLSALATGDLVLVRPGSRIPADGQVVDGSAEVDESMLTGESRPLAKEPGAAVIACPPALGLAIPLVIAISTTLGARNGLLVKDRLALERAREVEVVIFDKTGTLTRGRPVIFGLVAAPGVGEGELVALAASVEA